MEEQPIDRGWSWVICCACSVSSFFISGPIRTQGIMFVEISDYFGSSSTTTSSMMSTMALTFAFSAPLAAKLAQKFHNNNVVFVGGILTFLGTFLPSIGHNVLFVCITFGVFTGMGMACIMIPSGVMLGYYFRRRRALATGISAAGGSVGSLLLPLLFTYLLQEYGYRGGMLIFSAILLHVTISSQLLRPTIYYRPPPPAQEEALEAAGPTIMEEDPDSKCHLTPIKGIDHWKKQADFTPPRQYHSMENVNFGSLIDIGEAPHIGRSLQHMSQSKADTKSSQLFTNGVASVSDTQIQVHEVVVEEDSQQSGSSGKVSAVLCCFCRLFDLKLFLVPQYATYIGGMCFGHVGYISSCVFIASFATEKGVEKYDVALLLSIAGGADLIGRVTGGWLGDLHVLPYNVMSGLCLLLTGVAAGLLPLFPTYAYMVVFALVLGGVGGTYVAQNLSVVIDLVGLARVSSGFSLSFLASSLASSVIQILLGYMRDVTGTFDVTMLLCGVLLLLGGVFMMLAGAVKRRCGGGGGGDTPHT